MVIVLVLIAFSKSHTVLLADATTNYFTESPNASQIKAIGCAPDKQFFPTPPGTEEIFTNDNKQLAGILKDGVLTIELEAREGMWFPETHEGQGIHVYAFAEKGKPLQLPGPAIRVPEGTIIKATIQNKLDTAMTLHGFCSRPAVAGDSIIIQPGATYEVTFKAGQPGTYFYRSSASDNLDFFGLILPHFTDSQLFGAFIIDPAGKKPDPKERIMMISLWNNNIKFDSTTQEQASINGLSWPFTERLTYKEGEEVTWKVINASNQQHPMHLHGFYYTVNSHGNLYKDSASDKESIHKAVTELLNPGETMSMKWVPERPGGWLFHCHTIFHIAPESFLRKKPKMEEMDPKDLHDHVINGMGGLIMGLQILPSGKNWKLEKFEKLKERNLTLIVKEKPNWCDSTTGNGFILLEGNHTANENVSIPGPSIILNRDEPVAIKVINKLKEATTVHWHGLEIDSYFDGVSGWGNFKTMLAPILQPGDSFIVHMRPPRSGTFIYHTHMHNQQLFAGMYGAIIVKDTKENYDIDKNKVIIFGENNVGIVFVNGKKQPDTLYMKKGINYHFRIVNITAGWADIETSIMHNDKPVNWKPLAKDGADLPSYQQIIRPALNQPVSVGQTLDFGFTPEKVGEYLFRVSSMYGFLTPINMVIRVKE
ncbi:MAG TPA: multicopper oxidase domain-containing protein [Chitinophagaceae bacterium]|nr:multicopper oxidase domain-containing protein [Chitinophagaceae bacterium]